MNSTNGTLTPFARASLTIGRGSSPAPINRSPSRTTHLPTYSNRCSLIHSRVLEKSNSTLALRTFGAEVVDILILLVDRIVIERILAQCVGKFSGTMIRFRLVRLEPLLHLFRVPCLQRMSRRSVPFPPCGRAAADLARWGRDICPRHQPYGPITRQSSLKTMSP